ncbi:HIT-like domain-containing protein [Limtongia smithiae]|uniref:HIT-like domain-containing protein n=1 Tax=Limtongia smithiae TaxID=1125753 RepID=UPI0034CD0EC3
MVQSQKDCPFCTIADSVKPFFLSPSPSQSLSPPGFNEHNIILSTPSHIAFLDIAPLVSSKCHILLIPRAHVCMLADYADYAGDCVHDDDLTRLGVLLALLGRALLQCFPSVDGFNVVQNNGHAAAQVVPHVHFHIVARSSSYSSSSGPPPSSALRDRNADTSTIYARGQREDLDPEFAAYACTILRDYLQHHPLYLSLFSPSPKL